MDRKNVVIYVAGQRFSISTTDSEEYVIEIGEKVDRMIKGISKDNPRLNRDACAILAALDLCDDETKLRQMMEVLREQVKDYLRDTEELRAENAMLKAQLADLADSKAVSVPEAQEAAKAQDADPETQQKPSRQTAFVGKDFRSDKKKKRHEHNHQNPYKEKFMQKNAEATPAPAPAPAEVELPEDLEFPDTPYQFNLFDDFN